MNRRSKVYAGLLLLVLVATSLFVDRGTIQGLTANADVTLVSESTYVLGQTIVYTGSLAIDEAENSAVRGVVLSNTTGVQALSVQLPIESTGGVFVDLSSLTSVTSDSLLVKVTHTNVTVDATGTLPGTLPGGTLPEDVAGTTLQGTGMVLGGTGGGSIDYVVQWTPGVLLDPAPSLTLIPDTDSYFTIPTLTPPSEAVGTKLPDVDLKFVIPSAGTVAGTALPNVTSTFTIPQITVSTNAPSTSPDLPDTTATSGAGFAVPTLTAATSTAADFPLATDAFAIPTVSVATSTITSFGTGVDEIFIVPDPDTGATSTAQVIKGMTHDGTDFWFIVAGANNDRIIKVDGSTYELTNSSTTAPGTDFDGIAYAGGALWVIENRHRCFDDIETSSCQWNSRLYKIDDPTSLPVSGADSSWAADATNGPVTLIVHAGQDWDMFGGVTAGDSGTVWLVNDNGDKFYNLNANGVELDSVMGEWQQSNALAFNNSFLYTANGSTIIQWTDSGSNVQEVDVGESAIKSLTFDSSTIYMTSNADGKVYAAFMGETVDQSSPLGIAYSTIGGESALWVLLDGTPKDKLLKINPTTGALMTNFSTDGVIDAPSDATEGIEFFNDALWIIANEGSGWDKTRKLFKVNTSSGSVESGYPKNLNTTANVYDDLGDITNNGTQLVLWTKSNFNDIYIVDENGAEISRNFVCCPMWNGAKALAYHAGQELYYAGSNTDLSTFQANWENDADHALSVDSGGTTISSIQGAVFNGDNLYTVAGARIYQSFLAASVTTRPRGITYSPSTAPGQVKASLWLLVDASPFDQIMRVDAATSTAGTLDTTFDTDGVADAPSGNTEGLVFITEGSDNFLYIIANDGDRKNLFKYNVKTNVVVSGYPKDLSNEPNIGGSDLGGITTDGTNLIVFAKTSNNAWSVTTDGEMVTQGWPCCGNTWGMKALAYQSTRELLYGATGYKLVLLSSDLNNIASEETLTVDTGPLDGVEGMTFADDVLYVARYSSNVGYVTSGALRTTVQTKPQAIAISPSDSTYLGQSVGAALWVVVDGSPKDRVIKVDIDSISGTYQQAMTAFGSDSTGSVELPASNIKGATYLNDALYVIGDEGYEPVLYKLNPISGAILETEQLCSGMMGGPGGGPGGGGGGGCAVSNAVGGMANDGTNLIMTGENEERLWWVTTEGEGEQEAWLEYMLGGADAIAKIIADGTYWTAKGSQIQQWISPKPNELYGGTAYTVSGVLNIQGLAIDQTTKTIYIGWNDGTDGKISTAVPPSPITNIPLDMAYNSSSTELYILVSGGGGDAVIAVSPTTGEVLTDGSGADRYYVVNSEDATAVAYLDGKIYVAYESRGGGPMQGPPPTHVDVIDFATMTELGSESFTINSDCGMVQGMDASAGELIVSVEWCGPRVEHYQAEGGYATTQMHFWNPSSGFMEEGFEDVAYSTSTPLYFVATSNSILRIDDAGGVMEEWNPEISSTPLATIRGLELVGTTVWVADASTASVYTALVPLPTITITNTPTAMTTDGSSFWVSVDAVPVDKIMKLTVSTSTATVITSFDSPGAETTGLAIHDGDLFVLVNDTQNVETGQGQFQLTIPILVRLDKDTGAEIGFTPLVDQWGGLLVDLLGGLSSDGDVLYSGSTGESGTTGYQEGNGSLYAIDLNNIHNLCMFGKCFPAPAAITTEQFAGVLVQTNSFQAFEVSTTTNFGASKRLITAGGTEFGDAADKISRFNIDDVRDPNEYQSLMTDQYALTGKDIRGMVLIDTILYLANADGVDSAIIGTSLPENTGVELTIVGDFTTSLEATTNDGTFTATTSYAIERNTNMGIELLTPVNFFVSTGTVAVISGRVTDPSMSSVSVGIELPFTEFLEDEGDGDSTDKWTVVVEGGDGDNKFFLASGADLSGGTTVWGDYAWRFGYSTGDGAGFGEGQIVSGAMVANTVFSIAEGSELSFTTAWDTEPAPDLDRKTIQLAEVSTDLQGNDVVGGWQTIGQIVPFADEWSQPPANAHNEFQWVIVDPEPFTPGQAHPRSIDLSPWSGERVKIRFFFDSDDEFGNQGFGWIVDDITVTGAGTKTITVATTMLATPTTTLINGTSTTVYREFSTTFTLAEGENRVVASGSQSYYPLLSAQASAVGFVDTMVPIISLSGLPAYTNNDSQQVTVIVEEPTLDMGQMEIRVTSVGTDGSSFDFLAGTIKEEGTHELTIFLGEGTNTVVATAVDGGGLSATAQVVVILDTTPPVAEVEIVTVTSEGEAVVGDEYFIVVAAVDPLSGLATAVADGAAMATVADTPAILTEMHSLGFIDSATTTHIGLSEVGTGTPVGANTVSVVVTDNAGNSVTVSGNLNVVSARSNRNYFLFPLFNFMGLAIIPDDDDENTTDDASLDRLMLQDVSSLVNPSYASALGGSVTLGDVVESTFAFNSLGNFIVHTPGDGALDTLTELDPFQGMIVKTLETVDSVGVFKKVNVTGFTALQSVPIRVNIEGVFFRQGELPPDKVLRTGYNLVAPHSLTDRTFDNVYRGALIPDQLAVSAITFEREVESDLTSEDDIRAEVTEAFVTNALGDYLNPVFAYWTFIVAGTPTITP
jgi:hypothetical protein